ncbi:uncharacterized protein LOC129293621 isoform X3 [Prosopis cineraria]|uniref:uncharacterized protein LOC129293621 isoform X3 n=1 Tax=Prosopis cineraria TaxID=364024 RepID=UPI00241094EF|nr:uncharacterized protein LOC129293621 isoform X3 [Prosopis cineraria]
MENTAILREWFDRVDSDRSGNITVLQLKRALSVGNLEFPLSVVQQMIRMYDFDRNGTMNFEEFVALNKFLLKVQHAFSDLERKVLKAMDILNQGSMTSLNLIIVTLLVLFIRGRGFLVPEDVHEALVKVGFMLDSPAFYTVCESFDQSKNGRFRLDDFISLCIFVQSARNLFNSFDTAKQGRVTLDFNQFVYCTGNCRI